jgi:hypothetical protein
VVQEGFVARELENDRLAFDPKNISSPRCKNHAQGQPAAPIVHKLEAPNGQGMAPATQNSDATSTPLKPPAAHQPNGQKPPNLELPVETGLKTADWN